MKRSNGGSMGIAHKGCCISQHVVAIVHGSGGCSCWLAPALMVDVELVACEVLALLGAVACCLKHQFEHIIRHALVSVNVDCQDFEEALVEKLARPEQVGELVACGRTRRCAAARGRRVSELRRVCAL